MLFQLNWINMLFFKRGKQIWAKWSISLLFLYWSVLCLAAVVVSDKLNWIYMRSVCFEHRIQQ